MTYLGDESAHKQPIELFQFNVGGVFHRFTDNELALNHPVTGNTYTPEPITRGNLQQSDEDSSMVLEITVDALNPVAEFFRTPLLPARTVYVLVERTHAGATATPAVVFRGQVTQCEFDGASGKLSCVPMRQAIRREIPAILVQGLCTNTLYDARCQVAPAAFQVAGTATVVAANVLTITGHGKPDGYFSGGFITQAGAPAATIREHIGNTFKLLYNYGFTPGPVALFPGCDKRYSTCGSKFANTLHHQGFPNMPAIDPFVDQVT